MKYWYIEHENDTYWIEVDDKCVASRQIVASENGLIQVSCFEDCLIEGPFNPLDMDGIVREVTSFQFEGEWLSQIEHYLKKWEFHKSIYSIGKVIKGKVLYLYPQGYIISIGDAMGCIGGNLSCDIGEKINGTVEGYDDQNMWLLVSKFENNLKLMDVEI